VVNPTVRTKDSAEPPRMEASGDRLDGEPFCDSHLAATLVRVALAIEKREREEVYEAVDGGLPGARGSRGANESSGSLNLRAESGATSHDVPMRPMAHSVEEAL